MGFKLLRFFSESTNAKRWVVFARAVYVLLAIASILQAFASVSSQTLNSPNETRPPELVLQDAHSSEVLSIDFNTNESLMVSGSEDGTIKLWLGATGKLLRTFRGHTRAVRSVAFVASNKSIISSSEHLSTAEPGDNTTRLWSVANGKQLLLFSDPYSDEPVSAAAKDAKVVYNTYGTIVSWTDPGDFEDEKRIPRINIWNGETGEHLRSISQPPFRALQVSLSDDGKILLLSDAKTQGPPEGLPGHWGDTKLISAETGELTKDLDGYSILSPDGGAVYNCPQGGSASQLVNARNGQLITTIPDQRYAVFSPDGRVVAVKTGGVDVTFYDSRAGTVLYEVKGPYHHVVFSPDSRYVALDWPFGRVDVWKIAGWERKLNWKNENFRLGSPEVVFSRSGGFVAVLQAEVAKKGIVGEEPQATKTHVEVFNSETGLSVSRFSERLNENFYLSRQLIFSRVDGTLPVLTETVPPRKGIVAGDDVRLGNSTQLTRPTFSLDGKYFALEVGDLLKIWDAESGDLIRNVELKNQRASVRYRGKTLLHYPAVESDREGVLEWSYSPNLERALDVQNSFFGFRPNSIVRLHNVPEILEQRAEDGSSQLKLYDTATNRLIRTLKVPEWEPGRRFTASADGRIIAQQGGSNTFGYGKLLNSRDGAELPEYLQAGEDFSFNGPAALTIAFSPKSSYFVYESGSGVVNMIDLNNPKTRLKFEGHEKASFIRSFAFTQDEEVMASSASDNTTRLWSVKTGKLLATVVAFEDGNWLIVTPNGLFDGSPAAWSRFVWRFSEDTFDVLSAEAFFSEFFRPGLLAEVLSKKEVPEAKNIAALDRHQPSVKIAIADSATTKLVKEGATVSNRTIRVEVTVGETMKGSGAKDVRLFRNGSLVKAWRGNVLEGQNNGCRPATNGSAVCETVISAIAGANTLTSYAFNRDNVRSEEAKPFVFNGSKSLERKGSVYVLAIGINKYANPMYELRYAVADANELSRELKLQQERLGLYGKVEVPILLLNENAKKADIIRALEELASRVQPEDAVIVYFAGHGTARENQFYLIPYDLGHDGSREISTQEELMLILDHSISDRELERVFEKLDAGRLLLVIDACNSGQALEAEEKRRGPMNSSGLAQLAYEKGMYILTAAQSYQAALEVSRSRMGQKIEHGLLTFALLEGLSQAKKDTAGRISERNWMNFAVEKVPLMQIEEMKKRSLENKTRRGPGKSRTVLAFALGDKENRDPEKRVVQRPRVFYRRELEARPLIVAKQ